MRTIFPRDRSTVASDGGAEFTVDALLGVRGGLKGTLARPGRYAL
jgi:hypothetical protein